MAIAKAERLMNLALCLLGTRRPLTKRELRTSIEVYMEAGNDDAFNRMFERDKDDLRELGLVIDTVESLDGEVGYRAQHDSNRLPPITLDAEEAAATELGVLASRPGRQCPDDLQDTGRSASSPVPPYPILGYATLGA